MIRTAWRIALLLACAVCAAWVAEHPGHAVLTWGEWQIETSLALLAVLALLTVPVLVLCWLLLWNVLRLPGRMRSWAAQAQRERGLNSLTKAHAAFGAKDVKAATRYLDAALKQLGPHPLVLMLQVQIACQGNNKEEAARIVQELKNHPATRAFARYWEAGEAI